MIVPTYWAEQRITIKKGRTRTTVRRFGWSDESPEAAQAHADTRAQEAAARVERGETLERFEPKMPYNGADGVPIREEIVARHGETIITRNGYGARCLNTPNVLFADLDVELGGFSGWLRGTFGGLLKLVSPSLAEDPMLAAQRRVQEYAQRHPNARLRLYRTPAGYRLLAVHRTFAPDDPEVAALFSALGVDPVYVRMCLRQRCFRARLSAKPWRVGISRHVTPRNGAWPPKPERVDVRRRWVEEYERAARGHAACRFVGEYGEGVVDPQAAAVQQLHDDQSQAEKNLPLA